MRHTDSTSSAWLGDHAWGCSACGFIESLATLADALGIVFIVCEIFFPPKLWNGLTEDKLHYVQNAE
jgi:hypothetical protein